jgi:lipopolysaccharide transport system permease protein
MIILWLVFSLMLHVNIPNFAAWLLIGLLVWRFFSIGTSQGLASIVANPSFVTKVHLNCYVIVLSNTVANLVGATLEFLVLLPLLFFLGVNLTAYVLILPAILILESILIFAVSLALSSLNLKYRDFYQLWDIALQLGFFLSPIVYDASLIPARYRFFYSLNPVTRLIESTRSIFLLQRFPTMFDSAVILCSITIFLIIGFLIFGQLEVRFAEDL